VPGVKLAREVDAVLDVSRTSYVTLTARPSIFAPGAPSIFAPTLMARSRSCRAREAVPAPGLQMKRDVLDAFWKRAGLARAARATWKPKPDLLRYVTSL
jgi:hypothetical protein